MRRGVTAGGVLLAVAVAGVAGFAAYGGRGHATGGGGAGDAIASATAPVVRTDVAERQVLTGTLGHAGSVQVLAGGSGVVTRLPAVGGVVSRGMPAYEVDGRRVPLLYGARPAWRVLSLGMTDGADVRQLEDNLAALGYGAGMTVDRHFSLATYDAVLRFQKAMHLPRTGSVPLGQIVFAPGPFLVGGWDLRPGASVAPGRVVEHGTGDRQAVTVQLDPTNLPGVRVGDPVVITLPDESTLRGRVGSIGPVAVSPPSSGDGGGQSTAPVTVLVSGTIRGLLDQTQVQVSIVAQSHSGVLAVPTTALLARPGGTYAVTVGGRRIPVQTGLFDESTGLVEVSGPGLAAGQRVEVPDDGA